MNSRGPGPVPNRWLHCPRKSNNIISERFLAFKTPLSRDFDEQVPPECRFPPDMIFGYCKTTKLKLGLWIDLTNTKRFYDRRVVEENDTQYIKLQCRGHGETPSPEQTQSFVEIVDNFINERPFDVIAVHCTHGYNRTGFLICSFLIERLDYSVEAALAVFAESRPPGIYKQDYINELFRRYEDEDDATQAPELPDWCNEFDDSDRNSHGSKRNFNDVFGNSSNAMNAYNTNNHGLEENVAEEFEEDKEQTDESTEQSTENGQAPRKKRRREMVVKNAQFMEGVPGISLVTEQPLLSILQAKVQDMCGWDKSGFPGAQPVSMDQKNIRNLHDMPYKVSWKADGTRYMMLINKCDEIYFFDRNNSCFQVSNLQFLKAANLSEHLEDTLLDGEMVIDHFQGVATPRYLIYDIITISNRKIGDEPFSPNRMDCIKREIINPRHEGIRQGIINRPAEPFGVRHKEFWDIDYAASLLGEKFAKSLLHDPDGLIFQPAKEPYTPGQCPNIFKWKPLELNSVDFRVKIVRETGQGMLPTKVGILYVGGVETSFAQIKYSRELKDMNNKIIECTIDECGQWKFLRERTDKTMPNSFNTAKSVIESIRYPVTKDFLLQYIYKHGYRDEKKIMPPPTSNHVHRSPHLSQRPQQY